MVGLSYYLCRTPKEMASKFNVKSLPAKNDHSLLATLDLFRVMPEHSIIFRIAEEDPSKQGDEDFNVNAKDEPDETVLGQIGQPLCLGRTRDGFPRHPARVSGESVLETYVTL